MKFQDSIFLILSIVLVINLDWNLKSPWKLKQRRVLAEPGCMPSSTSPILAYIAYVEGVVFVSTEEFILSENNFNERDLERVANYNDCLHKEHILITQENSRVTVACENNNDIEELTELEEWIVRDHCPESNVRQALKSYGEEYLSESNFSVPMRFTTPLDQNNEDITISLSLEHQNAITQIQNFLKVLSYENISSSYYFLIFIDEEKSTLLIDWISNTMPEIFHISQIGNGSNYRIKVKSQIGLQQTQQYMQSLQNQFDIYDITINLKY